MTIDKMVKDTLQRAQVGSTAKAANITSKYCVPVLSIPTHVAFGGVDRWRKGLCPNASSRPSSFDS